MSIGDFDKLVNDMFTVLALSLINVISDILLHILKHLIYFAASLHNIKILQTIFMVVIFDKDDEGIILFTCDGNIKRSSLQ